jgi:hypothetical protein
LKAKKPEAEAMSDAIVLRADTTLAKADGPGAAKLGRSNKLTKDSEENAKAVTGAQEPVSASELTTLTKSENGETPGIHQATVCMQSFIY